MRISSLLWDDQNVEHIARHGVTPEEVEEVCFGVHVAVRGRYGRYILYGNTDAGRYLFVVVERIKGGLMRPITAREMTAPEKSRYRRRMRRR